MSNLLPPHPIDFIFEHGGHHILVDAPESIEVDERSVCDVCNRPVSGWLIQDKAYIYAQYGIEETHCTACHTHFMPSPTALGSYSNTGASKRMNQLGGLEGCGFFVSEQGMTLLVSESWNQKLRSATAFPFQTQVISSNYERDAFAIANMPDTGYCLYLQRMGRAKHRMLQNLSLSNKLSGQFVVCTDGTPGIIDLKTLEACKKTVAEVDPKRWQEWVGFNIGLTHGRLTPGDEKFQTLFDEAPELWDLQQLLPVDPWVRRYTLAQVR